MYAGLIGLRGLCSDLLAEAEIDEWMEYAHALQSCDPHNPKALSEVLKVADTRYDLRVGMCAYMCATVRIHPSNCS